MYAFLSISYELTALYLSHISQYISVRMFVVSSYGLGMTFQALNEKWNGYILLVHKFNILDAVSFEFLGCFWTWPLVLNSCIVYLITLVDYLFKGPIMPLGVGCNKYGGKQKCWECNSLWVCADHYGYWGHRWFTGACYQHSGAFLGKPRQQYKVHMYIWSCSLSVSLWVRLFKGGRH